MILSRDAHASGFSTLPRVLCMTALAILIFPLRAQQPDGVPPPASSQASTNAPGDWHSDEAVHLIGLPEIKDKGRGSLSISPSALTFVSPEGNASVARSDISSITVGDVSVETGGTGGKITRAIIPFGGGAAVATVTHKRLSLLTIEFRDRHDAHHGAVFLLPKDEAVLAQQQLGPQIPPAPVDQPHRRCVVTGDTRPETIQVAAIVTQADAVPAEYTVLLYEQLVRQLQDQGTFAVVYRAGDDQAAAACPNYNLLLTINAFKKGNAALRASTGPVGFFVGATSLKFHVQVQDLNGKTLFEKELHASQRGDTDSLNIGDKIAKSLTKDLKRASAHAARS